MKRMQIRHSIVKDKAGYRRTCAAPNFGGKKCNDVMQPDVPAHRGLFALYDRRNKRSIARRSLGWRMTK